MQPVNWLSFLTFLLVTALSPGPNNLSCISMGVNHGYKDTLLYIWGIVVGITLQSVISGMVSRTLLNTFPIYDSILRVVGAVYILWLAFQTIRSSYVNGENNSRALRLKEGFLLQFLNVKAILFVLTVYTAYLTPVLGNIWLILLVAMGLGVRAFLVNSTYALFGAGIRRWLDNPAVARGLNILIALMLAYSAAELLGLPEKLFN